MGRSGARNSSSPAQVSRQHMVLQALKDALPEGEGADRVVLSGLRTALEGALSGELRGVEAVAVVGIAGTSVLFNCSHANIGEVPLQAAAACLAAVGDLVPSDEAATYGEAAALAFSLAGDHAAAGWARDRFRVDLERLEPMLQASFAIVDPSTTDDVLERLETGALRTLVEAVRAERGERSGSDLDELVRAAYLEDQARGASRSSDWAANLFFASTATVGRTLAAR